MCNMGMAPMDPCGPTKLVTLFLDSPVFWGIIDLESITVIAICG